MPASIPHTYRTAAGIYHLRYLFPQAIRAEFPGLGREVRFSLRTREHRDAKLKAYEQIHLIHETVAYLERFGYSENAELGLSTCQRKERSSRTEASFTKEGDQACIQQALGKQEFYMIMDQIKHTHADGSVTAFNFPSVSESVAALSLYRAAERNPALFSDSVPPQVTTLPSLSADNASPRRVPSLDPAARSRQLLSRFNASGDYAPVKLDPVSGRLVPCLYRGIPMVIAVSRRGLVHDPLEPIQTGAVMSDCATSSVGPASEMPAVEFFLHDEISPREGDDSSVVSAMISGTDQLTEPSSETLIEPPTSAVKTPSCARAEEVVAPEEALVYAVEVSVELPEPRSDIVSSPGPTFSAMVERFFADQVAQKVLIEGSATYRKYTGYMRNVVEVVGADTPITAITSARVMDVRNALLKYPARRFVGGNAERTLADLLSDPTAKTVSKDTACEYFDRFKAVLDHACVLDYIPTNPAAPVKIKKLKGRSGEGTNKGESRKPFTDDDLQNIFNGYIYHGEYSGDKRVLLDAHYWVPLIAMYTGMRVGEICQLQIEDIHTEGLRWHGREFKVPYIQVCEEHQSQRLKNANATRKVPIHQKLIDLGFLEYVEQRRQRWHNSRNRQLFDGMRYEEHSKWGRVISRWFNGEGEAAANGYKHKVLDAGSLDGKVFHSFRHTFIDILRNTVGKGGEHITAAIVGHENDSSTNHYGDGLQLDVLKQAVDSVRYSNEVEALVSGLSFVRYQKLQRTHGRQPSPSRR